MLRVENIHKSFGGVEAIQGSNFSVASQRVTALIGPNGAGKTTLFDIITGFVAPDAGEIFFENEAITRLKPFERARRGLCRTFQQVRLFSNLSIFDHAALVFDNGQKWWHHLVPPGRAERERCVRLLERVGLSVRPEALVSELSYGQRKLLQLSLALERPHTLLFLDEPVAGVNKIIEAQIEKTIMDLKQQGETILLIDHDMQFVRSLADQVVALDAGIVVAEGTADTVLNNPVVLEAYLGN